MSRSKVNLNHSNVLSWARAVGAVAVAATLGFAPPTIAQQIAGEWTSCVAWRGGRTYNIVNGDVSRDRCFELARLCTGNPNVRATYYTPKVVVSAPYERCAYR
jgi:hypothetical protein